MSVLSYVHQLFNVDQCQAYIHTLRWKDRPLQCPRCQSRDVNPWGTYHYRPGCKRYWCNGCQRTFNDLTATLLHQSRRSLPHWIRGTRTIDAESPDFMRVQNQTLRRAQRLFG